jgi:hypothetical protein
MAIGPWSVHSYVGKVSCGSPFQGKYFGQGDAITPDGSCFMQAANRRLAAELSAGVAFLLLLTFVLVVIRVERSPQ